MYSPYFTVDNKIFCLSLHYNSDNSDTSYLKKINKIPYVFRRSFKRL